ncbi:MAG: hypothetical protein GMKNLPBB_01227 [Myxococcota bacterium]|nr:hypothetical protein [Myxococcota bacterium]
MSRFGDARGSRGGFPVSTVPNSGTTAAGGGVNTRAIIRLIQSVWRLEKPCRRRPAAGRSEDGFSGSHPHAEV